MTDFSRPNAQWSDLPSTETVLSAWHFEYEEVGGVGYLTLASGQRRRLGAGLIVTDEAEVDGGTVVTWGITAQVNGEVEVEVSNAQGVVYITG